MSIGDTHKKRSPASPEPPSIFNTGYEDVTHTAYEAVEQRANLFQEKVNEKSNNKSTSKLWGGSSSTKLTGASTTKLDSDNSKTNNFATNLLNDIHSLVLCGTRFCNSRFMTGDDQNKAYAILGISVLAVFALIHLNVYPDMVAFTIAGVLPIRLALRQAVTAGSHWVSYYCLFVCVFVLEHFAGSAILYFLPLWHSIKLLFLLVCMCPSLELAVTSRNAVLRYI